MKRTYFLSVILFVITISVFGDAMTDDIDLERVCYISNWVTVMDEGTGFTYTVKRQDSEPVTNTREIKSITENENTVELAMGLEGYDETVNFIVDHEEHAYYTDYRYLVFLQCPVIIGNMWRSPGTAGDVILYEIEDIGQKKVEAGTFENCVFVSYRMSFPGGYRGEFVFAPEIGMTVYGKDLDENGNVIYEEELVKIKKVEE